MNWGRAVGAAACLAAVVMSGSACANTVEGTPHAQGSATPASGAPSPKAAQSVGGVPACADIGSAVTAVVSGYSLDPKLSLPAAGGSTMCFFMKGGRA
ncbi:hypothetical protein, partial [Prescottella defluvii]|uniref:hypothetical protein n=1 Tax=Prescottella defluvii TaxID=1323361 RepID=UPI0039E8FBB4